MSLPHTIVVLDAMPAARADRLRPFLPPGFVLTHGTEPGEKHMKEIIRDADFAISAQVAVSGDVLRAARRLKLLHKWGVGVDNFDIETARRLGIKVARTTGSNALPVAEFTIGLMLSTLRFSAFGHQHLQQGVWRGITSLPAETLLLTGKTIGIIGFGAIGQNVARLLRSFRCKILYTKRTPLAADEAAALGAVYAKLDELIETSDVISLHCPLTPETRNMIDATVLSRMKRSAILVNVARGGVVVEADLAAALRARTIRGAAMDVFSIEPLPATSELIGLDNIVLTPHLAAVTADTFEPTVRRMFDNIARVARGEPVPEHDSVV
jgi:phosphoglycerate dehydrogenase-like enzyme